MQYQYYCDTLAISTNILQHRSMTQCKPSSLHQYCNGIYSFMPSINSFQVEDFTPLGCLRGFLVLPSAIVTAACKGIELALDTWMRQADQSRQLWMGPHACVHVSVQSIIAVVLDINRYIDKSMYRASSTNNKLYSSLGLFMNSTQTGILFVRFYVRVYRTTALSSQTPFFAYFLCDVKTYNL